MAESIVVDTNLSIRIIKDEERVIRWFRSVEGVPIFPCFIVMELFASCQSKADRAVVQRVILDEYTVYWPTVKVIRRAYQLVAENYSFAKRLKVVDALIAACVMELHAKLYTHDKDFINIPGLKKYTPEIFP